MNVKIKVGSSFLSANFYIPKNKSFDKLVIILPGYLDSKDYPNIVKLGEFLTSKGYLAVSFDPTGTWESGGSIEKYSISQYLLDIKEVIKYSEQKFNKEFSEIIIVGHSLGGMVGLLYAAKNKEIKKVVVMMSPNKMPTLKWENESKIRISKRDCPGDKNKIVEFRVPFSFAQDSLKYDVLNEVSKINIPIFLMAGQNDEKIKTEIVKLVYKKANSPKKYIFLKGVGHDYRSFDDQIKKVNKEVWKFLEEKN